MNSLIIGYGSIGNRHAEVLNELGSELSIVSKRDVSNLKNYKVLTLALLEKHPDLIIIANNTNDHIATLLDVRANGFEGPVLVEKPLSDSLTNIPDQPFYNTFVAYNMRFNPLLVRLKNEIENDSDVISVHSYVGQYLPTWNNQRDYRETYSAKKDLGGGVIRDLSHELDFICWIFGEWRELTAIGGKYSNLEIDTDDIFSLMFTTKLCPSIFLQMNYLDRVTKRTLIVKTIHHVYEIDFIKKTYTKDDKQEFIEFERNHSYLMQIKSILYNNLENLCSFESGRRTLNFINCAEKAAYSNIKEWVKNEENM